MIEIWGHQYVTGQTMLVAGGITAGSTRALPAHKP
jgi:hypothetical protein